MTRSSCFQIGFLASDWGDADLAYKAALVAFTGFWNELGEPVTGRVQVHEHESLWTKTLSLVHMNMADKNDEGWMVACAHSDKNVVTRIGPSGFGGVFSMGASNKA